MFGRADHIWLLRPHHLPQGCAGDARRKRWKINTIDATDEMVSKHRPPADLRHRGALSRTMVEGRADVGIDPD
jgi:hypothetical protein